MESLLISGVNGYLGKYIFEFFAKLSFKIYFLKRYSSDKKFKLKVINANFPEKVLSREEILKIKNPIIINCASATPSNSIKKEIFNNNVNLSLAIIELIKLLKDPKLINISSQDAYGQNLKQLNDKSAINEILISESDLYDAFSSYGASKLCSEYIFNYFSNILGFYNVSLRIPAIVGSRSYKNPSTFISKIAAQLLIDENLELFNKDSLFNNLIHLKTISEIIKYLIISNKFKLGLIPKVINISSNKPLRLEEVIGSMKIQLNSKSIIKYRVKLVQSKIIDTSLAESLEIPLLSTKESLGLFLDSIKNELF